MFLYVIRFPYVYVYIHVPICDKHINTCMFLCAMYTSLHVCTFLHIYMSLHVYIHIHVYKTRARYVVVYKHDMGRLRSVGSIKL